MGRWFLVLAVLFMWFRLGWGQENSGNWTEADVSAFERLDGEFSPTARISVVNYIADKGIGLFIAQGDQAGPLISWRAWEHKWNFGLDNAIHLLTATDLMTGARLSNGWMGFDIRWGIKGAGNIEVSTKLLWYFEDNESTQWTPAVGFVIRPSMVL